MAIAITIKKHQLLIKCNSLGNRCIMAIISDAILALDPNAKVKVVSEDYNQITWFDNNPNNITVTQLNKKAELDPIDVANEYKIQRKRIPINARAIRWFISQWIDGWKATIKAIKDKYPRIDYALSKILSASIASGATSNILEVLSESLAGTVTVPSGTYTMPDVPSDQSLTPLMLMLQVQVLTILTIGTTRVIYKFYSQLLWYTKV